MASPLLKLMQYGAMPINSMARRVVAGDSEAFHDERKNYAGAPICAICGKARSVLEYHIQGKHPEAVFHEGTWYSSAAQLKKTQRKCAECHKTFVRLAVHLRRTHGLWLLECPHCFTKITLPCACRKKCPDCGKLVTVGKNGKPIGNRIECPDCFGDFYVEKFGVARCPTCRAKVVVGCDGKATA